MYQKGIAKGVALGLARPWKQRNNFKSNTNMNELIVLLQGIAFGSSPYHIDFHILEPLSRQKSASHKDSSINTFPGFSYRV